jgi:bifunctional N-acetylglucosamine-1-phosphate-uridyltransferase/glucosamine-1-phosphate-acetyltransferase GlmU-like protein
MADDLEKMGVVILAAGRGKRMHNQLPLPKVIYPLHGQPMMSYLLAAIAKSELKTKPTIVIAPDLDVIQETFGEKYDYAIQREQLGTGHAVFSAKEKLQKFDHILVLYGDHPCISSITINDLKAIHLKEGRVLTMATVKVPNFDDWRRSFYDFGRIIRNKNGQIFKIVEVRDATDKQKEIREINPSYFCFKTDWLWQNINKLKNNNAQKEYYLTDLVNIACEGGKKIATIEIDPREALGVNTAEQLELISQLID